MKTKTVLKRYNKRVVHIKYYLKTCLFKKMSHYKISDITLSIYRTFYYEIYSPKFVFSFSIMYTCTNILNATNHCMIHKFQCFSSEQFQENVKNTYYKPF